VPLFPTFHPSYLLRSPGEKVTAWKDLQIVMKRLGLPVPAQNPDPDVWGLR
jgi:DNA polymerase